MGRTSWSIKKDNSRNKSRGNKRIYSSTRLEYSRNQHGKKDNIVSIVDTQNIPGFTDNNEKDNTSNANVIISVETGELPIGLILALVALVGLETVTLRYAVVLNKRQKRK